MRKATQQDIDQIDDLADQIATITTKLDRLLKDINTPVAREALDTWIKRIDIAIGNSPLPDYLDIKIVNDTLADLKGELRRSLKEENV